jgi:methylated-DNA-[protein]-cysteine S-methyltransferase
MNTIRYIKHESPIGPLRLAASERGLSALYMREHRHVQEELESTWTLVSSSDTKQSSVLDATRRQLDEYFEGRRKRFDLPLDAQGTDFQRMVWRGLCAIDFGVTISYGELAKRIGNAKAMRAVGLANGRNPISIIVPCHRVIGADGSMTGYGGGIDRKVFLLDHEAKVSGAVLPHQLALV